MPFIFAILIFSAPLFSLHNLIIADYKNITANRSLDSVIIPLTQIFSVKFAAYGIEITDKTQSDTREFLSANSRETILKIKAEGDSAITLLFTIEVGEDRKTYAKQISYNKEENLEQNLLVMLVKILHVFENSILSRVQITSDPTYANLAIDKKVKAVTPWESYLPCGNLQLAVTLEGYESIEKTLAITPGNNRLNFTLMPLGMKDTIVVREKSIPEKKIPSTVFLLISGAGALLAGIFEWQYAKADREYDGLISNSMARYNSLHQKAEYSLYARNGGIVLSVSGLMAFAYRKLRTE